MSEMDQSNHPTAVKIRELAVNPHYTEERISEALDINEALLNNFEKTDAWHGMGGEIVVVAWAGKNFFEFTLETDGSWSFLHEIYDEVFTTQKGLNFEDSVVLMMMLPGE